MDSTLRFCRMRVKSDSILVVMEVRCEVRVPLVSQRLNSKVGSRSWKRVHVELSVRFPKEMHCILFGVDRESCEACSSRRTWWYRAKNGRVEHRGSKVPERSQLVYNCTAVQEESPRRRLLDSRPGILAGLDLELKMQS